MSFFGQDWTGLRSLNVHWLRVNQHSVGAQGITVMGSLETFNYNGLPHEVFTQSLFKQGPH